MSTTVTSTEQIQEAASKAEACPYWSQFAKYARAAGLAAVILVARLWAIGYIYFEAGRICDNIGFAMAPVAFYIVWSSGYSTYAIAAVVLSLVSENTIATQSCHVIVESPLVVFSAFTAFAWNSFEQNSAPFSADWFKWLFFTGVGLGLSTDRTRVNIFSSVIIQLSTLNDLRLLWRDAQVSWRSWWKHIVVRFLCLYIVPGAVDMMTFETLVEHTSQEDFPLVAYGAVITIQHHSTQGYLHSQSSLYNTGSKQQQVTRHSFRVDGNNWIIQKGDGTVPKLLEFVGNGESIRLLHVQTQSYLRSHDHPPPISEYKDHLEVSGYSHMGTKGDSNDEWRLEMVTHDGKHPRKGEVLLSKKRSKFKLIHSDMRCDLFSDRNSFPWWSFWQFETTCLRGDEHVRTIWTVESNTHPSYPTPKFFSEYTFAGAVILVIVIRVLMYINNNRG
ncbi:MAG: MIR motif-containing protein [Benniella sp.]|nr:MAG: MIR motif-containing protein [Benniella sp.]